METPAVAFWGAFFGAVGLMLAGSLAAFARSLHRVALTAALSALVSALFALAYLGWLPLGDAAVRARALAHVAVATSITLALMLLAMLGVLRRGGSGRRARNALLLLGGAVLLAGWLVEAQAALALSSLMAVGVGAAMLLVCLRASLRGDRQAWVAVFGVLCMLVALIGLSWYALQPESMPWIAHAVCAVAGIAYLTTMAAALWTRYAWLIEVREAMAHGPAYDPVTRMRSHAEMGAMVGEAFFRHEGERRAVGVIVISIGNLYALENLHGRAAVNHALFVCASRLRRWVPGGVEMGRLSDDGFLLLVRNSDSLLRLMQLGRQLQARLARPVVLSTHDAPAELEAGRTEWQADVGVGVLAAAPQVRPSQAVSMARAMSRTAWTYPSRIAWFDPVEGQIAELAADNGGL